MKLKFFWILVGLQVMFVLSPCQVMAGRVDGHPKISLHVAPFANKNLCVPIGFNSCSDANTAGSLSDPEGDLFFVYLFAERSDPDSALNVSCGITYDGGSVTGQSNSKGLDILSWYPCVFALQGGIPTPWPEPGSWIFAGCLGELGIVGYFSAVVYSADTLRVITSSPLHFTEAITCSGRTRTELVSEDLGYAVFSIGGKDPGCNPCLTGCVTTPIVPDSWGGIKAKFK